MAKKSMIAREARRTRLTQKYATRREALRKTIADLETSAEDQWEAMMQLQKTAAGFSPGPTSQPLCAHRSSARLLSQVRFVPQPAPGGHHAW